MRQTIICLLLLTNFVCYGTTTKVKRVIDGDTFETTTGEKVRLIGINAPEISDLFGYESKKYLSDLIENRTVDLQIDNIANDRDKYQRLLRYVILEGIDINKKMIADGYAFAYLKYKFTKFIDYKSAQINARENNIGIWADNKKGIIINEEFKQERIFGKVLFRKAYLIGSLILILILFGLYTFFKK